MHQGFSGGFFLPAQRSVHCKGGFFSSASHNEGNNQIEPPPRRSQAPISRELRHRRFTSSRPEFNVPNEEEAGKQSTKAKTSIRVIRPRHERLAAANLRFSRRKQEEGNSANSNQIISGQIAPSKRFPDVNSKFELAMQELHQIKDEYRLKDQRQKSAPTLVSAKGFTRDIKPSLETSRACAPTTAFSQQDVTTAAAQHSSLHSPRQKLLIAEMVMRKLYKKNLSTEQTLVRLEQENASLRTRITELETYKTAEKGPWGNYDNQTEDPAKHFLSDMASVEAETHEKISPQIVPQPTRERIERLDQQQLDYLRHLAAEQDKTITALQSRIESMSRDHTQVKQESSKLVRSKSTPRGLVNKLQEKLNTAVAESERHKSNYCKMKADFQRLLSVKTTTLCENPAVLSAGARELLQLMQRKMAQLEQEHTANVSLYNEQLYAVEQQTCESFAQKKMLEREMARIAQDVLQRDELDLQIEKCMVGVFDRLHQVESENLQLKGSKPTHIVTSAANK